MGSSFGISCNECGYDKEFIIGDGMFWRLRDVLALGLKSAALSGPENMALTLAHIKDYYLVKNASTTSEGSEGYKIYHCPKCGDFFQRFSLWLDFSGRHFEISHYCPACQVPLEPVGNADGSISIEQYLCPQCGNYSLFENRKHFKLYD